MDAETVVDYREPAASVELRSGRAFLCRSSACQVRYVQFPGLGEGTPRFMNDTADTFDRKGGRQGVSSVWDRATALYLRVMNVLDEQRGQGLVEYALIIAVVAVMLVAALVTLRGTLNTTFNNISTQINTSGGS